MPIPTRETADKILRLLGQTDGAEQYRQSRGGMFSRVVTAVICTSAEAADLSGVGAQCYPATVLNLNANETEQAEGCEVWLTVLGGDGSAQIPASGDVYFGLFAGTVDADGSGTIRPRVFAATGVNPASHDGADTLTPDLYALSGSPTSSQNLSDEFSLDPGWHFLSVDVESAIWFTTSGTTDGWVSLVAELYNVTDLSVYDTRTIHFAYPGLSYQCSHFTMQIYVSSATDFRLRVYRQNGSGAAAITKCAIQNGTWSVHSTN